jgi:hypothetical protein
MDNSLITQVNAYEEEKPHDLLTALAEREAELVKIIEALGQVAVSDDWRVLKELIFDKVVESLDRQVSVESKSNEIDVNHLYRLQGQLSWAKKYANLDELKDAFKVELKNIRNKIHG